MNKIHHHIIERSYVLWVIVYVWSLLHQPKRKSRGLQRQQCLISYKVFSRWWRRLCTWYNLSIDIRIECTWLEKNIFSSRERTSRCQRTCFPLLHLTVISNWAADSAVNLASLVECETTVNFGASQFCAKSTSRLFLRGRRKSFWSEIYRAQKRLEQEQRREHETFWKIKSTMDVMREYGEGRLMWQTTMIKHILLSDWWIWSTNDRGRIEVIFHRKTLVFFIEKSCSGKRKSFSVIRSFAPIDHLYKLIFYLSTRHRHRWQSWLIFSSFIVHFWSYSSLIEYRQIRMQ